MDFISEEELNKLIPLLKKNKLRIVYCSNEYLGLNGPFIEINSSEDLQFLQEESNVE